MEEMAISSIQAEHAISYDVKKPWAKEKSFESMRQPSKLSLDEENKKLRGLSRDKYCILTAIDGYWCVLLSARLGKPSSKRISKVMRNHISCHSTMIDDEEKSHQILVDEYQLKGISYPSKETSGMDDDQNPMNMINTLHRFFKRMAPMTGKKFSHGAISSALCITIGERWQR